MSDAKQLWQKLLSTQRLSQSHTSNTHDSIDIRNPFEKDIGRIVYSYPFRRMQDKTQVIPFPPIDFVHSRLTHSLEVATVGRSLGLIVEHFLYQQGYLEAEQLSFLPAILYAAGIAHDIGNPPFGHAGEKSISKALQRVITDNKIVLSPTEYNDLTNFEGNAFGFKLLTNPHNNSSFNLSLATLAAFTKYPCNSAVAQAKISTGVSHKKYGYFTSEQQIFTQIYTALGLLNEQGVAIRHPLAFLVEAADDLCYLVMDFEDGIRLDLINAEFGLELLKPLAKGYNVTKLNNLISTNDKIAYLRALAIGFFTEGCAKVFMQEHQNILNASFDDYLINHITMSSEIAETIQQIRRVTMKDVYRSEPALYAEFNGDKIIHALILLFANAVLNNNQQNLVNLLPVEYQPQPTDTNYNKLLKVACYVAGMTDSYAKKVYKKFYNYQLD